MAKKSPKSSIKKLYLSTKDKKLWGVCGGIAEYLDIDATLVRLGWVLLTLFSGGAGIPGYVIAALIIPSRATKKV